MELNQITVVNHPHPILPAADVKVAAHDWQGQTVRDLLLSYGYDDQQEIVIFLNDRLLTVEEWDTVCPSPGDIVNVKAVVSGGDGSNPLMVVLMIAVMVLSAGAGTAAAAAAEAAAAGTGAAAGALASATVMVAGTLLINAMFKPSTPKGGGSSEQTYSLSGGSNSIRRYDPLPVIFGTHIFYPDYGALPYVENKGQDQYLNQMLNLGLSNCIYTDWKIGDTLLSRYRNVKTSWGPNGQAIYGFPGNVDTVQGAEIDTSTGWVTRTTSADTSAIAVDIEGVAYYGDKEDGLLKVVVELEVQYSPAGARTWQTMVSHSEQVYHPYYWSLQVTQTDSEGSSYTYQISYDRGDAQHVEGETQPYPLYSSENTTFWVTGTWHYIPLITYHSYPNPGGYYTPITVNTLEIAHIATQTLKRSTVKINVAPGQYDVRVRMLSARTDYPYGAHNLVKSGELEGYSYHWTYLRSYQTDTATYEGQTRLGLTIKASGQLNGTLDRISCIASAYCYVFDGTSWSWATTSNPAWWFLDFARGRYSSTGKKLYGCFLPDSQIDLATIKVWATFCDAEGLTFNYVLSQQESSWDTIVRIARCGLGSPSWASGKLGVVWDAKNQSPVAAFGMSNIIKGSFEVAYATENLADEIVVNYADASDGYEVKQVRVTVPGVATPNNPTETALEGCTNATMAGKYANVLAAQQYYRRRQITWESDFEGFVCQRGDVVLLQHDLTQWGYSGRLVDVVGDTLTLDRTVERNGNPEYCMIVEPDGTMTSYIVEAHSVETTPAVAYYEAATLQDAMAYNAHLDEYWCSTYNDGDGYYYISRFDAADCSYISDVAHAFSSLYTPLVYDPTGQCVWAYAGSTLYKINWDGTYAWSASLTGTNGLWVSPVDGTLWSKGTTSIYRLNKSTGAVDQTIACGTSVYDLAFWGDSVWFSSISASPANTKLYRAVISTGTVTTAYTSANAVSMLVVDTSRDKLWWCENSASMVGFDMNTLSVSGATTLSILPSYSKSLVYDSYRDLIWSCKYTSGLVAIRAEDGTEYVKYTGAQAVSLEVSSDAVGALCPYLATPSIAQVTFTAAETSTSTLTLTTTPTTQSGYDLIDHRWFFSPLATPGKLVKIVSIQPISESRVRIVATDEDSAYYTAWGGTWTAASQTSLLTNARPEITNASILETLAMLTGSVIGTMVTINFSVSEPIDKVSGRWRIASGDWELFEVQLPTLEIRTLLTGLLEVEATPIKGLLNGTTVTYSQTIYGKTAAPATPQNLTATITDAGISLAWDKVTDLDLKEYQVYVNGTFTTTVTSPYWRWPHIPAGTTNFEVYSIDTSGNLSSAATASVTIAAPSAPSVAYSFSANQVMLSITPGSTQLSIDYYEVFYTSGETLVSLGKTYSTVFSTLGSWSGSRLFTVKAVDLGGNVSAGGTVSVAISPPSTPTLTTQVIDNNVLLYWTEASGSLPVATYEVRKGATWASAEVIGKKSGGFTTVFETQASTYTYWVAAIDTAGNYGTPASRTATVSQPPDYVLHMNQNSDFSGTKSNAVLDAGALLLPVNTTETFQEHFTTPDPDWATPQAQIDAGYPYYIQPGLSPGYYEETFDAGQVLPAMKVVLTLAGTTLVGTCVVTTRISLSETGSAWADYDGVSEVFGTNFRYAKIKVTVTASATGAIYSLTGLNIRLEAKLRNDAGSVQCLSTDTLGTYVNFAQRFTDVSSVTATPAGTSATTVAYDFHDALDTGLSYSVVSNVATISHTSQPFVTGQKVYLMVTSGGGVSGEYTVASTSANSYTVAMTCANTTGTLSSYPQSMRIYAFNPTTGARVSSGVSWSIKGY